MRLIWGRAYDCRRRVGLDFVWEHRGYWNGDSPPRLLTEFRWWRSGVYVGVVFGEHKGAKK